jgi:hypothetical protein
MLSEAKDLALPQEPFLTKVPSGFALRTGLSKANNPLQTPLAVRKIFALCPA